MGTIIDSVATYSPRQVIQSTDLMREINSECKFGIAFDWIDTRVGIFERRFSDEKRPSDLAINASRAAFIDASIDPKDIDAVIFCGIDKDYEEPATAINVQHAIGATNAWALDMSNACHGFLNAIHAVDSFFKSGAIKTALICTGEQPSKIALAAVERLCQKKATRSDFSKYVGGLTTGDAGAAMILQHTGDDKGFKNFNIKSLPQFADLCYYKKSVSGIEGVMVMDKICKAFLSSHEDMFAKNNSKFDMLITHQVGKRPHKRFAEMVGLPLKSVPATYPYLGNITSATIPAVLTYILNSSKKAYAKELLIFGVGSGLTISQTNYKI